jgi:hypothetical protein
VNVSDTAHTFTVTGQGIDIETMPGKTTKVTIDLPPGTYAFVCRFHESMGMKGLIGGARSTQHAVCRSSPSSPERVGVVRCWMGSREEERAGWLS